MNKCAMWLATGLGILSVFLTSTIAFSQGSGATVTVANVNPKTFPEITAAVAVLDANGTAVPNLTRADFQILEDTRPVAVNSADAFVNPDAGLSVCLAIDVSGSMVGKPIDDAKVAAKTLVDDLGSRDRACIVAFSDKIDISTPLVFNPAKELNFTGDKTALKNLIDGLAADEQPGTPLYDAALKAIKITATQSPSTRAVILFTDGKDERLGADGRTILPGSVSVAERPIAAAKEAHIPVFTVGLGKDIDSRYLQRLAEETGGKYQETPTSDTLAGLFRNIFVQLRTQYAIKYTSQLFPDGKEHVLQVRVRTPAGETETSSTFTLPRDVVAKPFIRLYYKEGDERRDLVDGQKLKGTSLIVPEIATARVISFTVFLVDSKPVYTTTVAPWAFSWDTSQLSPVRHTLAVRAQDDEGAVGEASVKLEIVPLGIVDRIVDSPLEAKIGVVGLALLAIVAVTVAMMRTRRLEIMCPRGIHVMPPGETACPFCAEDDRRETLEGLSIPSGAPPESSETISVGETISIGSGDVLPTVSLERPPLNVAFLVMEQGAQPGREFTLHTDETMIGRAGTNDIIMDESTVGRQQAKIKREGKDYCLYDLGATNTTLVNDKEVEGRRKLVENDRIEMGHVVFVFKQVRGQD